jgi:hypothetical protein
MRFHPPMVAADYCTAPTEKLPTNIRRFSSPAVILSNSFDRATYPLSRRAVRRLRSENSRELLRICYAGKSRNHQRDFGTAADTVARVSRERPHRRLVTFQFRFGEKCIVPLRNCAPHLEEALESVRSRTLEVLALIVVDDTSTDTSLSVAVKWARHQANHLNRIIVLRNRSNAGASLTRNAGIGAADAPWVVPIGRKRVVGLHSKGCPSAEFRVQGDSQLRNRMSVKSIYQHADASAAADDRRPGLSATSIIRV